MRLKFLFKPLKMIKTGIFFKATLLVILFTALRIFNSCTPPPPIGMDFNTVNAFGVDHSGKYTNPNTVADSMYSEAVAISVTISDSTLWFRSYSSVNTRISTFSLTEAKASDYTPYFYSETKVVDMAFHTIYDIDETIKAGDRIDEHIYFSGERTALYHQDKNRVIESFKGYHNAPYCSALLIFRPKVQNNKLQFKIDITLEDGRTLTCLTNTVKII